jgi:hypothetical protein
LSTEWHETLDLNQFIQEDDWFDLWHIHVDSTGAGNQSPTLRHEYLEQLFTTFNQLCNRIRNWKKPRQTWVLIDAIDSSQDAVYLHTENPNDENFPYEFEGVIWGSSPPEWLREFILYEKYEFGMSDYDGNRMFWVREMNQKHCALE